MKNLSEKQRNLAKDLYLSGYKLIKLTAEKAILQKGKTTIKIS